MTATTHPIRTQSKQAVLAPGDKPTIRFIKRQEVEGITGISCTEIYRRIPGTACWKARMSKRTRCWR